MIGYIVCVMYDKTLNFSSTAVVFYIVYSQLDETGGFFDSTDHKALESQ